MHLRACVVFNNGVLSVIINIGILRKLRKNRVVKPVMAVDNRVCIAEIGVAQIIHKYCAARFVFLIKIMGKIIFIIVRLHNGIVNIRAVYCYPAHKIVVFIVVFLILCRHSRGFAGNSFALRLRLGLFFQIICINKVRAHSNGGSYQDDQQRDPYFFLFQNKSLFRVSVYQMIYSFSSRSRLFSSHSFFERST